MKLLINSFWNLILLTKQVSHKKEENIMLMLIAATTVRNLLLNALVGRNSSTNLSVFNGYSYLALSSTKPTYTSSGDITGITEPPTGQGYKRKLIGHSSEASTLMFGSASNGKITNVQEIHFDQAKPAGESGTGWGSPLKYFAIYNVQSGGSPIVAGELSKEITVGAGYVVILKAGDVTFEMNTAG